MSVLNNLIESIQEYKYRDIMRKQKSVTKLFPSFYDRVKAVGGKGGIRMKEMAPERWHYKVASGTKEGIQYDVYIKYKNIVEMIKKYAPIKKLWTNDQSMVNYRLLAAEVLNGVDLETSCSCLTGDTKIPLLDGRILTMQEILGEFGTDNKFWIYSSDEMGNPIPKEAYCLGVTKYARELIEVTLDNSEVIRCTTDHRFRMRDGTYKEAQDLRGQDSLMPIYFGFTRTTGNYSQRYLKVKKNHYTGKKQGNRYKTVHRLVAETVLKGEYKKKYKELIETGKEKYLVVHHRDFNALNNDPGNLKWMGKLEHWLYHAKLGKVNCIDGTKRYHRDPKNREKIHRDRKRAGKKCKELYPENYVRWNKAGAAWNRDPSNKGVKSQWGKERWLNREYRDRVIQSIKKTFTKDKRKEISNRLKGWWSRNPGQRLYQAEAAKKMRRTREEGNTGNPVSSRIGRLFSAFRRLEQRNLELTLVNYLQESIIHVDKIFPSFETALDFYTRCKRNSITKPYRITEEVKEFCSSYLDSLEITKVCIQCGVEFTTSKIKKQQLCGKICRGKAAGLKNKGRKRQKILVNHKVESIKRVSLCIQEPVYDLWVEGTENFALSAGVFVHNCPASLYFGPDFIRTKRTAQYGKQEYRPPREKNPRQYGVNCKHGELVFELLPMYTTTFASFLKKFYSDEVEEAFRLATEETEKFKKAGEELGQVSKEEEPAAFARGGKEVPLEDEEKEKSTLTPEEEEDESRENRRKN